MIYPFLIPWMKEKLMSLDFTFTLLTWLEARNKHIGKIADRRGRKCWLRTLWGRKNGQVLILADFQICLWSEKNLVLYHLNNWNCIDTVWNSPYNFHISEGDKNRSSPQHDTLEHICSFPHYQHWQNDQDQI